MWERIGAIFFVITFPFLILPLLFLRFERETKNKKLYYSSLIIQTFIMSCLVGFWIHFIPCFWLTCDGSQNDNIQFRGILWICSWGISFAFILSCLGWQPRYNVIKWKKPVEEENVT